MGLNGPIIEKLTVTRDLSDITLSVYSRLFQGNTSLHNGHPYW